MTDDPVAVERGDTVRDAALRMIEGDAMGALVRAEAAGRTPGIVTAQDVLAVVARRLDPGAIRVGDHCTPEATAGEPDWPLERAAAAMADGGFRHLVVGSGEPAGVLSIRDVVRSWAPGRTLRQAIPIREAVRHDVPVVEAGETVAAVAERILDMGVGAAIVHLRPGDRPQLLTEREALELAASERDPAAERAGDHLAARMTYSAPDWSLKQAAEAMLQGDFQHVVVVDPHATVGIVSMRDVMGRWLA